MGNFSATSTPGMVVASGEIDMHSAAEFRAVLDEALADGDEEVSIDLGSVTFMDSTGLRVLLQCQNDGCAVTLTEVHGAVLRLLEVTGLTDQFGVAGP